jgi:hypothetical protein
MFLSGIFDIRYGLQNGVGLPYGAIIYMGAFVGIVAGFVP